MQTRHNEIEISSDDPFKNDALGRKELEPPLTQFITQTSSPFTLALDSAWGSGKTTFLKMWEVKLKQAGHVCLYLNAWKNDFAQDPLVAVVGELSEAISEAIKALEPKEKKTELQEKMKTVTKTAALIFKRSIPLAIKLATHGILDIEGAMEKNMADFASGIAEDGIKEYEKGKSEIEEFRQALTSLAVSVSKSKNNDNAKVVIIIDELDRCRPTYAVQLLERIKHLFDVSGVVFVLGIDRSQLNHSICALYGSGFDAVGYLKRFIDLDYRLPEPKSGNYCSYLFKYFGIEDLILSRQGPIIQDTPEDLKSYLGALMSSARMSLRVQEQTVSRLRIVLQTIPKGQKLHEIALSILLFLREWNIDKYDSFVSKMININIDELLKTIEELPNKNEAFKEVDFNMIEAYLLARANELELHSSRLENYQKLAHSGSKEPEVYRAQELLHILNNSLARYSRAERTGFSITANRIEPANNFISYGN